MSQQTINFTLNGVPTRVSVPVHMSALEMIRNVAGLTGTKYGCGEGECGACTILLDGVSLNSCLLFAVECDGRQVTTIEGLAADPLGRAREGLRRGRRRAVRLLHAGHGDAGQTAARTESAPERARRSSAASRATCAAAPAT
jgi:hypothetical protein